MTDNDIIKITDIFPKDILTVTTQGYKTECPDCGLQGGRTEGLILFPENNQAYCHSSGKWFKLLETYALRKHIIRCIEGRDKGDNSSKILGGELFTLTLDEFKNEYGSEQYDKLIQQLNIRKRIELPGNGRLISKYCDELGDVYKSRNVIFYRTEADDIVEIKRRLVLGENGNYYSEKGFKKIEPARFITLAEMFIEPYVNEFTKKGINTIIKSMSQTTAMIVLQSPNFQNKIPQISRLFDIQIPILYKGKLTFPKKGYDRRFESWLPYNAPEIKPDIMNIDEAKQIINKIFEEFCFETEQDRINAIAGFFTPFFRGLYPKFTTRTPVFIYMANRERAGKDYCAGCSGMIYEGVNIEQPAISCDEHLNNNNNDELRKKIMSCMLQGKKRYHSANNKGFLNNSIFEGVTTAEVWQDRILGKNDVTVLNNEIDYSLSGNLGIILTPDLLNRSRIINLHLIDEDANKRVFNNPNLHEWIYDNRELIISALYIIVKNWYDKGMPKGSVPFTSFPHWANICGGIMEAAGYGSPCINTKVPIVALDQKTEEMRLIFETCYEKAPNKWLTKEEIKNILIQENIIQPFDNNNRSENVKFGLKIDSYYNRVLSGITMLVDSIDTRAYKRKYNFIKKSNPTQIQANSTLGGIVEIVSDSSIVSHCFEKSNIYRHINHTQLYPTIPPTQDQQHNTNPTSVITNTNPTPIVTNPTQDQHNLEYFTNKFKEYKKKELEKNKPIKEISDRQIQFWDAEECKNIIEQCSKEQVLQFIRDNPGTHFEQIYETLGIGSLKHKASLLKENKIRYTDNGGLEVIE